MTTHVHQTQPGAKRGRPVTRIPNAARLAELEAARQHRHDRRYEAICLLCGRSGNPNARCTTCGGNVLLEQVGP